TNPLLVFGTQLVRSTRAAIRRGVPRRPARHLDEVWSGLLRDCSGRTFTSWHAVWGQGPPDRLLLSPLDAARSGNVEAGRGTETRGVCELHHQGTRSATHLRIRTNLFITAVNRCGIRTGVTLRPGNYRPIQLDRDIRQHGVLLIRFLRSVPPPARSEHDHFQEFSSPLLADFRRRGSINSTKSAAGRAPTTGRPFTKNVGVLLMPRVIPSSRSAKTSC